jgi:hypothetical protein
MTEATAITPSPPVPLTIVDNLFSITHQFIDQYRRSIFIFTGTGIFFDHNRINIIANQYLSSNDSMVIQ